MSTSRTRRLFEVDPNLLVIEPWDDPTLAQYGFGVGDDYVEMFWLSTLGPTATWLLRRLVTILGDRPSAVRLDVAELSASLGIGSTVELTWSHEGAYLVPEAIAADAAGVTSMDDDETAE